MLIYDNSIIEISLEEALQRHDFLLYLSNNDDPYAFFHNIGQLKNISVECYDNGMKFYTIVSEKSDTFVTNCIRLVLDKVVK